jgi:hypothetical protein
MSFFYLSGLAILRTSFTVRGRWFIFRKLQLIASDIYLLSLPLSLKLAAFILLAIVSLDDFGLCLALFITLSFVRRGCRLFSFDVIPALILTIIFMCYTWFTGLEIVYSLGRLVSLEFHFVVFP